MNHTPLLDADEIDLRGLLCQEYPLIASILTELSEEDILRFTVRLLWNVQEYQLRLIKLALNCRSLSSS